MDYISGGLDMGGEGGTGRILPNSDPIAHNHLPGPQLFCEPPFEDGTMCGLMREMGTVFWSH